MEPGKDKSTLRAGIALLRPKDWLKNGFVLAPLMFSGLFTDPRAVAEALLAAALFCLTASTVYVVNDLHDLESDRLHPTKSRTRPLASGQLSIGAARSLLGVLLAFLAAALLLRPGVMAVALAYFALNIAYTFVLKHQPVIDIFTVAFGFVLRIYAGAAAIDVPVSSWMAVTTLCLTLYLAAIKRRQELKFSGTEGRRALEHYSLELIDRFAEMSGTGALLFYSLYVMSAHPELAVTIPLVLFGLFRYWFVVDSRDGGESPADVLLSDWQLSLAVLLWVATSAWVLWQQA